MLDKSERSSDMNHELFVCECGDVSHSMVVSYVDDPEWPDVYLSVHLSYGNLWERIVTALKYVFSRKKSIYGDFDEIILRPSDADRLQKVVDYLKKIKNNQTVEDV